MMIIVWGVSGSGKTTIAKALAQQMACAWFDADEFHPASNIEKMATATPLTDRDRAPWLQRLRLLVDEYAGDNNAVLACSALRACYRQTLGFTQSHVRSVYLFGTYEVIEKRLAQRENHFMPSTLLRSQFETLESEHDGLTLEITHPPQELVAAICEWLK